MYYIVYNEFGPPISDYKIEDAIDTLIEKHERDGSVHVSTSCGLFIDAVRMYIAEGKVSYDSVVFANGFMEDAMTVSTDKYGNFLPWPDWFPDFQIEFLTRIYEGSLEERRKLVETREKEK